MKQQNKLWIVSLVMLLLVTAMTLTRGNPVGPEKTLALQAPAFIEATSQKNSGMPEGVATVLSDEAGISAYIQTSNPIDLSQVEGEFRTIETQTADYIIGSVPVPDHPEHFDTHVYVHKNGWILAYYMEDEATSKMVDVKAQTIDSTKLETVVSTVAGAAGEAVSDLKYYDFRYPNATNILMVAEDSYNGREFTIQTPSDYAYSERSWAENDSSEFLIDGVQMEVDWRSYNTAYGPVTSSQLLPGESHLVEIDDYSYNSDYYGVLVITYRVP